MTHIAHIEPVIAFETLCFLSTHHTWPSSANFDLWRSRHFTLKKEHNDQDPSPQSNVAHTAQPTSETHKAQWVHAALRHIDIEKAQKQKSGDTTLRITSRIEQWVDVSYALEATHAYEVFLCTSEYLGPRPLMHLTWFTRLCHQLSKAHTRTPAAQLAYQVHLLSLLKVVIKRLPQGYEHTAYDQALKHSHAQLGSAARRMWRALGLGADTSSSSILAEVHGYTRRQRHSRLGALLYACAGMSIWKSLVRGIARTLGLRSQSAWMIMPEGIEIWTQHSWWGYIIRRHQRHIHYSRIESHSKHQEAYLLAHLTSIGLFSITLLTLSAACVAYLDNLRGYALAIPALLALLSLIGDGLLRRRLLRKRSHHMHIQLSNGHTESLHQVDGHEVDKAMRAIGESLSAHAQLFA